MSKRIKLVFIASIMLNIMLISLMAGKYYHRNTMHQQINELSEIFPEATGKRVAQVIRDLQQVQRDSRTVSHHARHAAFDTLRAEEFDAVEFKRMMNALALSRNQTFQRYTDAIVSLANNMSQEEREQLAAYLQQRRFGMKRSCGRALKNR